MLLFGSSSSCRLAPVAMQGFIRFFYPSRASRSRVASAEKQLCARGTALWTHIRCLVCKGKVGQSGPGVPGGLGRGGSRHPWRRQLLSLPRCSLSLRNASTRDLCLSWVFRNEGGLHYLSWDGKGRFAFLNLLLKKEGALLSLGNQERWALGFLQGSRRQGREFPHTTDSHTEKRLILCVKSLGSRGGCFLISEFWGTRDKNPRLFLFVCLLF